MEGPVVDTPTQIRRRARLLAGWVLVGLAIAMWCALLGLPFLPFSVATRASIAVALLVVAEVIFWIGCVFLGPEIAARFKGLFRRFLPRKQPVAPPPVTPEAQSSPFHDGHPPR